MADLESEKTVGTPHHLILEKRKKLSVSGVLEVESFEEQRAVLQTNMGQLVLQGNRLKMGSFNLQTGELAVTGELNAFIYTNDTAGHESFWRRIFK